MAIEQEMGLYQQSPPWCLPVWWTALVSGLQLHKTRWHQDQGEESPVSASLVTWHWLRVWEELKLSVDVVLANVWEILC